MTSVYHESMEVVNADEEARSNTRDEAEWETWTWPPVYCDGRTIMSVANIPGDFSVLYFLCEAEFYSKDYNTYSWCGKKL